MLDDASEDDAGRGSVIAAQSLFFGLGDLDAAERWIERGIAQGGPSWAALLRGKHAQMLMNAGRAREAIAEGAAVLADPDARPIAQIAAYSGLLPALAVAGRLSELREHLPIAQGLVADSPAGFTDNADGTLVGTFIGGLFEGRLPEIDPVLEAWDEAGAPARRRSVPLHLGVPSRTVGARTGPARRLALPTLREAAAVLRRRDPGGMLGWCLASLAQACGATGDARGARAAVVEFDEVHFAVMHNIDVEIGLGRAWALAAGGARSDAAEVALGTAKAMVDRGDAAVGIFALHDAMRLGAPPRVVEQLLADPAGEAEGPVVAAMARHVRAMASADLDELCARRRRLRLGLDAVARSRGVRCRVTGRARRTASRTRQREASTRAAELLADCGPALTPMLETLVGREALASLTRREQEVALMAARGTSKRAMSEQLGVSIRTVGNHINHVYGKLGISTREELAALLSLSSQNVSPPGLTTLRTSRRIVGERLQAGCGDRLSPGLWSSPRVERRQPCSELAQPSGPSLSWSPSPWSVPAAAGATTPVRRSSPPLPTTPPSRRTRHQQTTPPRPTAKRRATATPTAMRGVRSRAVAAEAPSCHRARGRDRLISTSQATSTSPRTCSAPA